LRVRFLQIMQAEVGFTTTFFAIMMPVFIILLGLCADGAAIIYQRIALETASDAASMSAIDSFDRTIWNNEHKVVLLHDKALMIAQEILDQNVSRAKIVSLEIPTDMPNSCKLMTEMEVPLVFLKLLQIDKYTIKATSYSHAN
jgi:hypothetical protein